MKCSKCEKEVSEFYIHNGRALCGDCYKVAIIIAHGDLDGVVSAVITYLIKIRDYHKIEICFTQPYWIADGKHIGDLSKYDHIYVVDIALNNRDTVSVMKFIQRYGRKLTWYDHHYGWNDIDNFLRSASFKCYLDEREKSCVNLIRRVHKDFEFKEKINGLIKLAHQTDCGEIDNLFYKAIKLNPKNDESRREIVRYALSADGLEIERQSLISLKIKASLYEKIRQNALSVLREDSYKKSNVLFIDLKHRGYFPIDKTLAFFEGYKHAPYVVLKYLTKSEDECITVATNTSKNLVKTFNLPSGQPYRITLFKPNLSDKDIIKKLN